MDTAQEPTNPLYCEELALEEMRRAYQEYSTASDVLDQKSSALLQSASLILALFGLLQLTPLKAGQSVVLWIGLGVAVVLYVALLILSTDALSPRDYELPIKADRDVVTSAILVNLPRDAVMTVLSGYVARIPHNRRLNEEKAKRVKWASACLALIVFLLVSLSLLQNLGIGI